LLIEFPHPVAVLRLALRAVVISCGGVLVEQVGDGDGFVAVRAEPAEPDAGGGLVAVVTPLLAVVAGVAVGAGVDGDVTSPPGWRDGFGLGCGLGVAASPCGLAAAA
jgi:hypothetical protein